MGGSTASVTPASLLKPFFFPMSPSPTSMHIFAAHWVLLASFYEQVWGLLFTREWATYRWLHRWRKLIAPLPAIIDCQWCLRERWGLMNLPPPFTVNSPWMSSSPWYFCLKPKRRSYPYRSSHEKIHTKSSPSIHEKYILNVRLWRLTKNLNLSPQI